MIEYDENNAYCREWRKLNETSLNIEKLQQYVLTTFSILTVCIVYFVLRWVYHIDVIRLLFDSDEIGRVFKISSEKDMIMMIVKIFVVIVCCVLPLRLLSVLFTASMFFDRFVLRIRKKTALAKISCQYFFARRLGESVPHIDAVTVPEYDKFAAAELFKDLSLSEISKHAFVKFRVDQNISSFKYTESHRQKVEDTYIFALKFWNRVLSYHRARAIHAGWLSRQKENPSYKVSLMKFDEIVANELSQALKREQKLLKENDIDVERRRQEFEQSAAEWQYFNRIFGSFSSILQSFFRNINYTMTLLFPSHSDLKIRLFVIDYEKLGIYEKCYARVVQFKSQHSQADISQQ